MKMLKTIIATSLLTVAAFQVNAATVTTCGTDVCFTYDNATLFGEATITGNSINFAPTEFFATSANLEGASFATDTISILVEAITEGFSMSQFKLQEVGDYFLQGESATANVGGTFAVTSETKSCGETGAFGAAIACSELEALNSSPLTTQGAFEDWTINSLIDISENELWNSDTAVRLQIQNNLIATSTANGDLAIVQKKLAGVGITVVPVPAAVWLLGSALGGLGFMRRRKAS